MEIPADHIIDRRADFSHIRIISASAGLYGTQPTLAHYPPYDFLRDNDPLFLDNFMHPAITVTAIIWNTAMIVACSEAYLQGLLCFLR